MPGVDNWLTWGAPVVWTVVTLAVSWGIARRGNDFSTASVGAGEPAGGG